ENDEVRAITRNCGICASWFSNSSDRPSEKYSCSLSELMLTKGSTAMDLEETSFEPLCLLGAVMRTRKNKPSDIAPATMTTKIQARWRGRRADAARSTSSVRFN